MNVLPVLEFLKHKIGLNPESIGADLIEKAVHERMKASGAATIGGYLDIVSGSAAEEQALIESVVISETSFFRNKTPFIALHDYLAQFVLNKKRERPLRILCLPCATGEEPYSIAMVLLDMKLHAQDFFIYAADISEQVLEIARAGMYSAYSFRGKDLDFRRRYFSERDGGYLLNEQVRNAVQFGQANILADDFLAGHKPYDIIFCRNLLIYFDENTKEKAIKALAAHLTADGVLFVGHAEGAKIPNFGFGSLDYPMSFAFAKSRHAETINQALGRKGEAPRIVTPLPKASPFVTKAKAAVPDRKATPSVPVKGRNEASVEAEAKRPKETGIAQAIKLADKGAFSEAATICEELLAHGEESAEVYYLLGRASGETGNNLMAEEYLRKSIYLDADFDDALAYMSVLLERMGNHEKAAIFRRRAERVYQRNAAK